MAVAAASVAVLIGAAGRFLLHYLSGIWFFANFAPAETPVALYTSLYTLSHLGPSTALNLVVVGLLFATGAARFALPDRKEGAR